MKRADLPEVIYNMMRVMWGATGDAGPEWIKLGEESRQSWYSWVEEVAECPEDITENWPKPATTRDTVADIVFIALVSAIKHICEEE